jgi:hypothetical protein
MNQLKFDVDTLTLKEVPLTTKDLARLRVTAKTFTSKKGGDKHDCSSCKKCSCGRR